LWFSSVIPSERQDRKLGQATTTSSHALITFHGTKLRSPYYEADGRSAGQEILPLAPFTEPKSSCHIHKSLPLAPILSQICRFYSFTSYLILSSYLNLGLCRVLT